MTQTSLFAPPAPPKEPLPLSQQDVALSFIRNHGSMTSMQAFHLGITRLADVCLKLRARGFDIETELVDTPDGKTKFARYRIRG